MMFRSKVEAWDPFVFNDHDDDDGEEEDETPKEKHLPIKMAVPPLSTPAGWRAGTGELGRSQYSTKKRNEQVREKMVGRKDAPANKEMQTKRSIKMKKQNNRFLTENVFKVGGGQVCCKELQYKRQNPM